MLRTLVLEFGYECQNLLNSTRIEGHIRSEKYALVLKYQTLVILLAKFANSIWLQIWIIYNKKHPLVTEYFLYRMYQNPHISRMRCS